LHPDGGSATAGRRFFSGISMMGMISIEKTPVQWLFYALAIPSDILKIMTNGLN